MLIGKHSAFKVLKKVRGLGSNRTENGGFEDTQPNADGILPALMKDAGFASIEETAVIPTVTEFISLYRAVRLEH